MTTSCPNCGETLVSYRTDRQSAGNREAVLHWTVCPACRHVALDHWELEKESVSGDGAEGDNPGPTELRFAGHG